MRPTQFHRLALLSLLGIALCGCTSRPFIRTAEFRFRVKDPQQSIRPTETTIRQ